MLRFNHDSTDMSLTSLTIGQGEDAYDILCDFSQFNKGKVSFSLTGDGTRSIIFDPKSALISSVTDCLSDVLCAHKTRLLAKSARTTPGHYRAVGESAAEVTSYEYDNGRLLSKTSPNGKVIKWERETNKDLIACGMVSQQQDGAITTTYKNDVLSGTVRCTSISTVLSSDSVSTRTFVFKSAGTRPDFLADTLVHMQYGVSADGRVTQYDVDPQSGLVQSTRHFTGMTSATSGQDLDAWSKSEITAKRFSLTQVMHINGTRKLQSQIEFYTVTANGEGVRDQNTKYVAFEYDDLYQCCNTITTRQWVPGDDPITFSESQVYNELGQCVQRSEDALIINEDDFWQNQKISVSRQSYTEQTTYSNTPDDKGHRSTTFVHVNNRIDQSIETLKVCMISSSSTDPDSRESRTTAVVYNKVGQRWKVTNEAGADSYEYYDSLGRLIFEVNALGVVTAHNYQVIHLMQAKTRYANIIDVTKLDVTSLASLLSQITPDLVNDRVTYEFLDCHDQVRFKVDEKGYVIEYRYDQQKNKIARIRYTAAISADTLYAWLAGTTLSMPGPTDTTPITTASQADYLVDTYYYNHDCIEVMHISPSGWVTCTDYDGALNVIRTVKCAQRYQGVMPEGALPKVAYDASKDIYEFSFYDRMNRMQLSVNARGAHKQFSHYLSDNVSIEIHYGKMIDIAALIASKSHVAPTLPAPDASDRTITRSYDYSDREILTRSTTGESSFTVYDAMGSKCAHVVYDSARLGDLSGDALRSNHSVYNLWQEEIACNSPATEKLLLSILSDKTKSPSARQQLVDMHWQQCCIRKQYDKGGLLLKKFNTKNDTTEDNLGATIYYYDKLSRLTFIVGASGQVTAHEYTVFNERSSIRQVAKDFDVDGRVYFALRGG